MYAQGFAWSSHGIAEEVLEKLYELLSPELRAKLPAARAAFAKRCEAVWGTSMAGPPARRSPTCKHSDGLGLRRVFRVHSQPELVAPPRMACTA